MGLKCMLLDIFYTRHMTYYEYLDELIKGISSNPGALLQIFMSFTLPNSSV